MDTAEAKAEARVKELEREKESRIRHYLGLQDEADALNERIYRVCCEIETLNRRIEQAREEAVRRQAQAALKPAGGNGNGANGRTAERSNG